MLLDEIIGHQEVIANLHRLATGHRYGHALLFAGPESVGKYTTALAFAATCLTTVEGDAANQPADVPKLLASGNYPDLHLVTLAEDRKDISVEVIRQLREKLQLRSYYPAGKFAVIDNAERLSAAACNALLMTLEEPRPDTYLILVSGAAQRLPATILSRCHRINFGYLLETEIQQLLQRIVARLGLEAAIIDELLPLTHGTFSVLELERYFNRATGRPLDPDNLKTHLQTLAGTVAELVNKLDSFFTAVATAKQSVPSATAVSLPILFDAKDEASPLAWAILRNVLRKKMREADQQAAKGWADLLLRAINTEKLVLERNAQSSLQLSALFVAADQAFAGHLA